MRPVFRHVGCLWSAMQTGWLSRLTYTYVGSTSTDQTFPRRSAMCTVYVLCQYNTTANTLELAVECKRHALVICSVIISIFVTYCITQMIQELDLWHNIQTKVKTKKESLHSTERWACKRRDNRIYFLMHPTRPGLLWKIEILKCQENT